MGDGIGGYCKGISFLHTLHKKKKPPAAGPYRKSRVRQSKTREREREMQKYRENEIKRCKKQRKV